MVPVFHPTLVNDPFDDPCLFIDIQREGRAVLFDLGNIEKLEPVRIMRISDVFVSHTHIDHFIGFDHLLRLQLGRDKRLRLYGPPGITRNVEGKLSAYTWNLVDRYTFEIEVNEISESAVSASLFVAREGFVRKEMGKRGREKIVLEEPLFIIETVSLDHKIPSLAFSIREKFHVNINKDMLAKLDLPVGPWLDELKQRFREEMALDSEFVARWERNGRDEERAFKLGYFLENRMVIITRGQKVTYVTDASGSPGNLQRIIELAGGSDTLFCEAAFLDEDREKALKRFHLTAKDAGNIAREAEAQRLEIFHFSPKYKDDPSKLYQEAFREFKRQLPAPA